MLTQGGWVMAVSSLGVCDDGLLELALFFGVRFSMKSDPQHLEQHEHGLEQSAAVCRHLARGAQALEFTFQRVERLAQRLFVDGGHDRCLTRIRPRPRPRPPSWPPAPRGVPPAVVPGSS